MEYYFEKFFEDNEDLDEAEKEFKKEALKHWLNGESREFNETCMLIDTTIIGGIRYLLWKNFNRSINKRIKAKFQKQEEL